VKTDEVISTRSKLLTVFPAQLRRLVTRCSRDKRSQPGLLKIKFVSLTDGSCGIKRICLKVLASSILHNYQFVVSTKMQKPHCKNNYKSSWTTCH